MSPEPTSGSTPTGLDSTALPRAERRRLADIAHDEIRARIVSGEYPMGSRLNEAQLSAELGTSRAPVREAIRRLAEGGLAIERPHQGAIVREFDAQVLADLYNVRASLERTAIRLVARRGMDTAPLRRLVDAMAEAAVAGAHHEVAHRELEFHAVLCAAAENQILSSIFHGLEGQMLMALALDDSAYFDLEEVAREHQPLIDAIEARDEATAATVMEQHILSTIGAVITRLGGTTDALLTPP